MGNRRLALLVGALLCMSSSLFAQPAEGEIEMEGDPAEPADAAPADAEPTEAAPEPPPPPVKDPKLAKKWRRAGDQLMRKGDQLTRRGKEAEAKPHYVNAVTAYQKAIELGDDVTLNYYLALAEDKAGMTAQAMKHLQVVIAAQGLKPALMKNAQAKLDDLSMKVGIVTLMIEPAGTQVALEGDPIGEAPLPEPLVLEPGTYKVTFTAVGFQPKDLDLKVEAGSESERNIELDPVPVVAKPQIDEPEPAPIEPTPEGPNKLPLYAGLGATGGLALVATITGIIAIGKHGTATDGNAAPSVREEAKSSGKTLALVTDICLIGAIGAATFTAYWYRYKYRPQARALAERQEQAKVDVVPWVQSRAGGLAVAGSF